MGIYDELFSFSILTYKLSKNAKIKQEGRLYNLRTFATNLIHNDRESITIVSGLLGHNDSIVTQKTYISNLVKSDSLKEKSIFG